MKLHEDPQQGMETRTSPAFPSASSYPCVSTEPWPVSPTAGTGSQLSKWGGNGLQGSHSRSRNRSHHVRAVAVDLGGLQSLHTVFSPASQGSLVTVTNGPSERAGLHGEGQQTVFEANSCGLALPRGLCPASLRLYKHKTGRKLQSQDTGYVS